MRTIGVDLAKASATTAMCIVRWERDRAVVESVCVDVDDAAIEEASGADGVRAVALDAPFGWPRAMVAAVSSWRPGGTWTHPAAEAFRLRETDRWVAKRTTDARAAGSPAAIPLSVAADKIAMATWRCCAILHSFAGRGSVVVTDALGRAFPDDGHLRVVEAYPAAALAMWRVPRQGYKSEDGRAVREAMIGRLHESGPAGWLAWSGDARATCVSTDHALDALVCALVARAAAQGLVHAVDADCADAARAEGWIALPTAASLGALVGAA